MWKNSLTWTKTGLNLSIWAGAKKKRRRKKKFTTRTDFPNRFDFEWKLIQMDCFQQTHSSFSMQWNDIPLIFVWYNIIISSKAHCTIYVWMFTSKMWDFESIEFYKFRMNEWFARHAFCHLVCFFFFVARWYTLFFSLLSQWFSSFWCDDVCLLFSQKFISISYAFLVSSFHVWNSRIRSVCMECLLVVNMICWHDSHNHILVLRNKDNNRHSSFVIAMRVENIHFIK